MLLNAAVRITGELNISAWSLLTNGMCHQATCGQEGRKNGHHLPLCYKGPGEPSVEDSSDTWNHTQQQPSSTEPQSAMM